MAKDANGKDILIRKKVMLMGIVESVQETSDGLSILMVRPVIDRKLDPKGKLLDENGTAIRIKSYQVTSL